jgi:hypothetical protein
MQCARDYQVLIEWLKEQKEADWLAEGVPTFLMSVSGTYLCFPLLPSVNRMVHSFRRVDLRCRGLLRRKVVHC